MNPVACDSCGARFPVSDLTEDDRRALREQHYYQELADELRMLLKVRDYYRRYPDAEGRIKPHQIELPPEPLPAVAGDEDREVVEYLRRCSFSLGPRLNFVSERVAHLQGSVGTVSCPRCRVGKLHVPPEDWDEFTAFGATTWVRPHWHSVDTDGTLHVNASGWRGGSHWTGEQIVSPGAAEYDFWRWLVTQEAYRRLVEVSELPGIREEWSRRTK